MYRIVIVAILIGLGLALSASAADIEVGALVPPAGFTALFNGRDLAGWKNAEQQAEFWKVEDGALHYVGKGGKDLTTTQTFKDFEMLIDWQLDMNGGDSGVFVRGGQETQVQIWDIKEGSGGLLHNPKDSPGQRPSLVADNPLGQWNTLRIKLVGDKVTVRLNDKLVVDNCVLLEGKIPAEGPLTLEGHRGQLRFRNIFIKELEAK